MKHTHHGTEVRYPTRMRPGDAITWTDNDGAEHAGTVMDRAANGVGDGIEAAGFWLWVMPEHGQPVRIRTWASGKRKGQAVRDDGPMWVGSSLTFAAKVLDDGHTYPARQWTRHRGRGPCECCTSKEVAA